jgi:hypothetical protein
MPTKPKSETTSPRVATIASKLLSNPKTPPAVKTVAASVLTQKVAPKKR